MNAEKVRLGGYQILTLLLLSVNFVIVAMSHALSIFYKFKPKFYCQRPEDAEAEAHPRNRTYGCPAAGGGSCPGGRYVFAVTRDYERSPATEWQLVCERDYLLRLGSDVYFAGMILGGCVAGILADRIGRLPVLAICLYAQGTMAVALNVVQEYQLFLVFRGMQGFFIQGLESCTFVLCMELFPSRFRVLVALITLSIRAIGLAILSGLSYAIADWRILQLVVSVPTAVTVLYIWMIPESPRWLLARGKTTEAEMLLEKIANYNRLCGSGRSAPCAEAGAAPSDRTKPQKPTRRPRADANNRPADVEKSSAESENLLAAEAPPRAHASAEDQSVDKLISESSDKKPSLSAELDIEGISKASLTVVADEKNPPAESKGEKEAKGQSYLLVPNEAMSIEETNKDKAEGKPKSGLLRFLESNYIGSTCALLMCLWFSSSMAFHALVSLGQRMSGERHVSLTLAAGMEIGAFLLAYLMLAARCGRRWPLCVGQLLVAAACLTIAVFAVGAPQLKPSASVNRAVIIIGRVANVITFFILRLVVIELFPTISRGTGVALCVSAEMIGGLLTPYALLLDNYVSGLPRFLIAFFCICTSLLTFIFPETSRAILPDSIEDAKNIGRNERNIGVLRDKLFSEDWVDAGNGIIINFTENNLTENNLTENPKGSKCNSYVNVSTMDN